MSSKPQDRSSIAQLTLIMTMIVSLYAPFLLLPYSVFAATPSAGVLTPLVQSTYSVTASGSISGTCVLCGISNTSNVTDSNTTNSATITLAVSVGATGILGVTDSTNTYDAGYFAGFVVSQGNGLLSANVLGASTIRTYNNGIPQEQFSSSSSLLSVDLLGNATQQLVGFVTTKPFDQIELRINAGLVGALSTINVLYAAVQSVAPAPAITSPSAGSSLSNTSPTLSGSAVAGTTVTVKEGSTTICTTTATGGGTWSCTPSSAFSQGSHTITATATNNAGTSPSSASVTFTVDTTAPSAPAITSPAASSIANSTTPTIAGTAEANSSVTVKEGATTLCTTTTNGSGSWSCTSSALGQGSHTISATATDAAGNTSSASASRSFSVDTVVPSAPVISNPTSGSNQGSANPAFSGTAEAGSSVAVTENGVTLCTATTTGGGTWTCTPGSGLSEGSHSVTASATDTAGNTSANSSARTFTVDLTAPAAPAITSPGNNAVTNDTTPTFSGTAEANSSVVVKDGSTTICTTTANGSGAWTCTPGSPLAEGNHSISATVTDGAGNTSSSSSPIVVAVDTTAPVAPVLGSPASNGTINTTTPTFAGTAEAGSTVTVKEGGSTLCTAIADSNGNWNCVSSTLSTGSHTVDITSTDPATNTSTTASGTFTINTSSVSTPSIISPAEQSSTNQVRPVISGNADASVTITVRENGNLVCSTTSQANGSWSCTPSSDLIAGSHTLSVIATNGASTDSSAASRTFTVDLTAPSSTPSLNSISNGDTLGTSLPTFSGSGAEAGSTVSVQENGNVLCTAIANGSGNWSCAPSSPLSDGSHSVTVGSTDAAGNTGPSSSPIGFTIDTTAPTAPVITVPQAGDSLKDTTIALGGQAEAGSTVVVKEGGTTLCTVTANGSGVWSCNVAGLAEGSHALTATATDTTGNTSSVSAPHSFVIDRTSPVAPIVNSPIDNASMNSARPAFSGTAEPGSMVTVSESAEIICSATADSNGDWTCTPSSNLVAGAHTFSVVASDTADNESPATLVHLNIDTTAPAAPVVSAPAANASVASVTPQISGTAEAGSLVTVKEGASILCTATANGSGNWSCTPSSSLSEGSHSIRAMATDTAGNISQPSALLTFVVDTVTPAAPGVSGPANGGSTNSTTPTFTGTAEPNSTITVSENGSVLCTATADSNGNWSCTPSTPLGNGGHTVTVTATDPAGNTSSTTSVTFTIDPSAVSTPSITSPAVNAFVNSSTPLISGLADASVTITVKEGSTTVCTAIANGSGAWSCTPGAPFNEGAHTISVTANNGTTDSSAAERTFTVDLTAPSSTPTITAPAASAVLNVAAPTFSGTGGEPNGTVRITEGGTTICVAAVNGAGAWSCTPTSNLADGPHTISATNFDPAGNSSATPVQVSFTIDTSVPATPQLTSPAPGSSTGTTQPTFTGTAEPGTTVTVSENGNVLCTAVADSNGNWSCTPSSPLSEGPHSITVSATDPAGNTSNSSPAIVTVVDTTAPQAPVFNNPLENGSVGAAFTSFGGTAEPGSMVAVKEGGTVLCTALVNVNGGWNCTSTIALSNGEHTVTAVATDAAGNSSTPASRTFTVDPSAVSAPVITSPVNGSHTPKNLPVIRGLADPSASISLTENGVQVCSATADSTGQWSCVPASPLSVGSHTLVAIASNGIIQSAPTSVSFTVDPPEPGVIIDGWPVSVIEGQADINLILCLASTPTDNVTITFNTPSEITLTPSVITLTPANAQQPHEVSLHINNNDIKDGTRNLEVTYSIDSNDQNYENLVVLPRSLQLLDNDIANLQISFDNPSGLVEGQSGSYTVALNSQPTSDVIVTVTPNNQLRIGSNQANSVASKTLTFTPANYAIPQTVNVWAADDIAYEDVHSGVLTHTFSSQDSVYNNMDPQNVSITIRDNELLFPLVYVYVKAP